MYIDTIREFPTPKNIIDIRSWFGLVNQVPNYAQLRDLIAPFNPFLSPRYPFSWTPELEAILQSSKKQIIPAICEGGETFDMSET